MQLLSAALFRFFALLLSFPTLTGGLLLRRKWRMALICALLATAAGALLWLARWHFIRQAIADPTIDEISPWLLYCRIAYLLVLAILLLSACVSSLRAKEAGTTPGWIKLAALGASVLATSLAYKLLPDSLFYVRTDLRQGGMQFDHSSSEAERRQQSLNGNIYFDNPTPWDRYSLPNLSGSGEITGIVRFRGEPASVTVKLFLDSYWRTGIQRTNKRGEFRIPVPTGKWTINRIALDSWFNKPEGSGEYFVRLRSPQLPAESNSIFQHVHYAKRITLDTRHPHEGHDLQIDILPLIDLHWPSPNQETQVGDPGRDSLAWAAVDQAASYELEIGEYTQDRQNGQQVRVVQTDTNHLPLKQLPLHPSAKDKEYYVRVRAMDAQGATLSTSIGTFGKVFLRLKKQEIVPDGSACCPCKKPDAN